MSLQLSRVQISLFYKCILFTNLLVYSKFWIYSRMKDSWLMIQLSQLIKLFIYWKGLTLIMSSTVRTKDVDWFKEADLANASGQKITWFRFWSLDVVCHHSHHAAPWYPPPKEKVPLLKLQICTFPYRKTVLATALSLTPNLKYCWSWQNLSSYISLMQSPNFAEKVVL